MARLFLNETGRAMIGENEEIGRWRWARKTLNVPAAAAGAPGELWIELGMYDGNKTPLEVEFNGKPLATILPKQARERGYVWIPVAIPKGRVKAGDNQVLLRSDNLAMNAWMLAVENGHDRPTSALSTDRGQTWRSSHMGAHAMLRGEYIIRLHSHSDRLKPHALPVIVYEDAKNPRVREMLDLLPAAVVREKNPWKQILLLRSWICRQWTHDPFFGSYAPWDPWTIMDWARRGWGHGRRGKVTMCVHYGAVMVSLASLLGHKARCVNVTSSFDLPEGHFMAEVWDKARERWVMHDPNMDVHYEDGDVPQSAVDMAVVNHSGRPCKPMVRRGPAFPRGPRRLIKGFHELFATAKSYKLTSIWTRNNFISDPTGCPPNQGSMLYSETDFVWYAPEAIGLESCAMFPLVTESRAYFDAPPVG